MRTPKLGVASRKYTILALSDLHCGSIFGLLPPKFQTSDGRLVGQNCGQKYLWDRWLDLCANVRGRRIAAIVVVGDAIDGSQSKQHGTELALPLMADQTRASAVCLRKLLRAAKDPPIYLIQGTEYHDARAGREVEALGESIGAEKFPGPGVGIYSKEVLDLDVRGVVVNFMHGIGVSAGLYRATAPDREGVWSALAGKEGKVPKADCVVRGHAHYFVHVEHENKHVVVLPCWELQTRYMRKGSRYRMLPSIGAAFIDVCPEEKERGDDPIHVRKVLYKLPQQKIARLVRLPNEKE